MDWPLDTNGPVVQGQPLEEIWPDRRSGPRSKKIRFVRFQNPSRASVRIADPIVTSPAKKARVEGNEQPGEEGLGDNGVE